MNSFRKKKNLSFFFFFSKLKKTKQKPHFIAVLFYSAGHDIIYKRPTRQKNYIIIPAQTIFVWKMFVRLPSSFSFALGRKNTFRFAEQNNLKKHVIRNKNKQKANFFLLIFNREESNEAENLTQDLFI